jgi:peptidoglycan hydrolase-like protein with peptidoglycan-binding domain
VSRVTVVVFACGLVACAHATQTAATAKSKPDEPTKQEKSEPAKPAAARDEMSTSKSTKAMFKPEGLKAMQQALGKKGHATEATGLLDTQTQDSLRAFQKAQTLPDTGLPDFETIRRLGLKPDAVFQSSPPAERVGVQ